jgi:hypothetical protein
LKGHGVINTGLRGCDDSIDILIHREGQVQNDSRVTADLWDCFHG